MEEAIMINVHVTSTGRLASCPDSNACPLQAQTQDTVPHYTMISMVSVQEWNTLKGLLDKVEYRQSILNKPVVVCGVVKDKPIIQFDTTPITDAMHRLEQGEEESIDFDTIQHQLETEMFKKSTYAEQAAQANNRVKNKIENNMFNAWVQSGGDVFRRKTGVMLPNDYELHNHDDDATKPIDLVTKLSGLELLGKNEGTLYCLDSASMRFNEQSLPSLDVVWNGGNNSIAKTDIPYDKLAIADAFNNWEYWMFIRNPFRGDLRVMDDTGMKSYPYAYSILAPWEPGLNKIQPDLPIMILNCGEHYEHPLPPGFYRVMDTGRNGEGMLNPPFDYRLIQRAREHNMTLQDYRGEWDTGMDDNEYYY